MCFLNQKTIVFVIKITILPSEKEGRKTLATLVFLSQLNKLMESSKPTKTKKGIGGRKKLPMGEHVCVKLQLHVTEAEKRSIDEAFADSGNNSMSDYLRRRLVSPKNNASNVNEKILLGQLDTIGTEIGRIGNNMNQIARYANSLSLRRDIDVHPIRQFNKLMDEYMSVRRELVKAYRAIARSLK